MVVAMGNPEKLLLMTTLESMENGEGFLCNLTRLPVLITTAPESSSGKSQATVTSGVCLPEL